MSNVQSQRRLIQWQCPEPSPRAIETERGCVEDQPQRVGSSQASGACGVLRLVEDDTAALRSPVRICSCHFRRRGARVAAS